MKIHSNDWEMTLNNAHDPSAEYILIPIIHYEIALLSVQLKHNTKKCNQAAYSVWTLCGCR